MILKTLLITTILYLNSLFAISSYGQSKQEKEQLTLSLATVSETKPVYEKVAENRNEVELVFSGLFLAYKSVFSSQDSNHCKFHPSCSEYGLLAVKRLGIVQGMLSTFDRLVRCNGLSPEKYEVDPQRQVLLDPVDDE